jgi:hypothetical protein
VLPTRVRPTLCHRHGRPPLQGASRGRREARRRVEEEEEEEGEEDGDDKGDWSGDHYDQHHDYGHHALVKEPSHDDADEAENALQVEAWANAVGSTPLPVILVWGSEDGSSRWRAPEAPGVERLLVGGVAGSLGGIGGVLTAMLEADRVGDKLVMMGQEQRRASPWGGLDGDGIGEGDDDDDDDGF